MPAQTRRALVAAFVPRSPLVRHLGIVLDALEDDLARLRLPYDRALATMGDVVHGGAIAALLDTAGMAAAWANDDEVEAPAGSTVSLTVDYLAPVRGADIVATARALRRGRTLCFCEVDAEDTDGRLVAKALMTHKYG
jgi:uncharacterized protein (TIGR00369 family)